MPRMHNASSLGDRIDVKPFEGSFWLVDRPWGDSEPDMVAGQGTGPANLQIAHLRAVVGSRCFFVTAP